MNILEFNVEKPLIYMLTGKFEAPSSNWKHENLILIDYELILMTAGVLYLTYEGVDYTVRQGQMLLLPPVRGGGMRSGFQDSYCEFYWLHFTNHQSSFLEPSLITFEDSSTHEDYHQFLRRENYAYLPQLADVKNPDKIIVQMKQLQDAVRNNYNSTTLNYLTTAILCEIHSQFHQELCIEDANQRANKQIYDDIIEFVKRNATSNIKVIDVANHFGYNEKYLSHLFKKISGYSLKQYIINLQMNTAKYLLTDTDNSIGEISNTLGHNDVHNFCKIFKKNAGMTPSEYRNAFSKRLLYHK